MYIYFVSGKYAANAPYGILDARHKPLLGVGDICILSVENGMEVRVINENTTDWDSCGFLDMIYTKEVIGQNNTVLFFFDGISRRRGDKTSLNFLAGACRSKSLKKLFLFAVGILDYKEDGLDSGLYCQLLAEAGRGNSMNLPDAIESSNGAKPFVEYLGEIERALFFENTHKGNDAIDSFQRVRCTYPKTFRKSLLRYFQDCPGGNIFDFER